MSTERVYLSQVKTVSEYLTKKNASTVTDLILNTGITINQYRRMIKNGTLTTSLNHDHNWVTLTSIIKRNSDKQGLFKSRIAKHSKTVVIFSVKRSAKRTLSYLVSRRSWGLTYGEAEQFLGRDCRRPLKELEKKNSIQSRIVGGERIFLNRIHKKADLQVKERKLNPRFRSEDKDEEDKIGYIKFEDFCRTLREVLKEMKVRNIPEDRIQALLLMFSTNRSFRTTESWIKFNERISNAIGLKNTFDHTTLCRDIDRLDEDFLKEVFHRLVIKLHDDKIITGKFLVVDATHIYAYCSTKRDTNKYGIEGASWGDHHGSFYGYKVHILVDAESELPVSMIFSTGKDHDSVYFMHLIEDFDKRYDFEDVYAVLGDAAYDIKEFRKATIKKTGGKFLPTCNPRRSKVLKRMKERVKKLFEKYGNSIRTVEDGLNRLGQTFLTRFGVKVGNPGENKLVELIGERIHRPFRSSVERVFSRLKLLSSFEQPRTRDISKVVKIVWFCLIGQLVQAKTAVDKGLKGAMRKRTCLV
ncbi:MAG: transposase [Candidatus Lokiarchaeota archaeon]|nr:transposase [Candidatus Lokiarchaeota archaeon]